MNPKLQALADGIRAHPIETSGDMYHPLPFPEFDHLKLSSNPQSAHSKWSLIFNALPSTLALPQARVLDIGANAGYYSFNFAQRGAKVTAFEPHPQYANLGKQIAEATQLPVTWHNKPLEQRDLAEQQYDVAIMLSVFQWISRGNENLPEATELFKKVATISKVVFFELGCNEGKSAIRTSQPGLLWVWRFLKTNAPQKTVYYLGTTVAWGRAQRYLFVCSAEPVPLTLWQKSVTGILRWF